jgi:hypothetical protein
MKHRSRYIQIVCVLGAVALLAVATQLHRPMARRSDQADLLAEQDIGVLRQNPELSVVTTLPGGLRVLALNYLWLRSQEAHMEGRHFDAYQLADAICRLQPYYPGVWAFHAWNMAWNISVTTHTPQERWQWIYNGVELLRDRGIPLNPESLILYKELAWIFVSKIGGNMDEMHTTYKARWAGEMQRLLGAPPNNEDTSLSLQEATALMVEAFRPIAEAPLNRDRALQGRKLIQDDARGELLSDPAVAAYAERLAALGVGVDESFLEAYNAWSRDVAVDGVRLVPPEPETPQEQQLSAAINDEQATAARSAILAFVRAQLLWNRYRMDPQFMLRLMERGVEHDGTSYALPLDWRHAMSHGLYWAAYGLEAADLLREVSVDRSNNMRNVLIALKKLTSTGQISLQQQPENPLYPQYFETPDLRYIEPTHQQHLAYIELRKQLKIEEGTELREFKDNVLAGGHTTYLIKAMKWLVADARVAAAQRYFEFCKNDYQRDSADWQFTRVQEFIVHDFTQNLDRQYDMVIQLLQLSLKRAMLGRAIYGHEDVWEGRYRFARILYQQYQQEAVDRMKLPGDFQWIVAQVLARLLAQPQIFGVNLTLQQRSRLLAAMDDQPRAQAMAYHMVRGTLARLSALEGVDFEQAFPQPRAYEQYLREIRSPRMSPETGQ